MHAMPKIIVGLMLGVIFVPIISAYGDVIPARPESVVSFWDVVTLAVLALVCLITGYILKEELDTH